MPAEMATASYETAMTRLKKLVYKNRIRCAPNSILATVQHATIQQHLYTAKQHGLHVDYCIDSIEL
jgi:hypothetical protein